MTNRNGILLHSPLTHAIASVRFAPWANLPNKIADIQDELRDIAPLLNAVQIQTDPSMLAHHSPASGSHIAQAWVLMSLDKSFCIQFAPEQLLVFATKYTRFSDFLSTYRRALTVLLKHMRFVDVINMGVRYVDRITAKPEEKISDYISDKWLPPTLNGHERAGGTVFGEYSKDSIRLRVTAQSLPNALPIPNDVLGMILMSQGQIPEMQLQGTSDKDLILDMDSVISFSPPRRMETEMVCINLDRLHSVANDFFRNSDTITDHAFRVWQGEN
jgi:uncharacterized protein (TIGR04255 family)